MAVARPVPLPPPAMEARATPAPGTPEYVALLSGLGLAEDDIARLNGIDTETLRARFGAALAHGKANAEVKYRHSLLQQATGGSVSAAVQWRRETAASNVEQPRPYRRGQSVYDQAIADEVCRRLGTGESLRTISKTDGMPPESTVRQWALDDTSGFAAQYARARELQAHAVAEAAVAEALACTDPQLGRLAFDARKWFAGKLAPKHYGDKVQAEVSGPDGAPLPVVVYVPANGRDPGT